MCDILLISSFLLSLDFKLHIMSQYVSSYERDAALCYVVLLLISTIQVLLLEEIVCLLLHITQGSSIGLEDPIKTMSKSKL